MSNINVTVTVTTTGNGAPQCTYNPVGPYIISRGTDNVVFTLNAASISLGWQYTGNIQDTAGNQLSAIGKGNAVTVCDLDNVKEDIGYQLGMSLNNGPQQWSDPQNDNTGNN